MKAVIFRGVKVASQQVLNSIRDFDEDFPDTNGYDNWLEKSQYKYAIEYEGKLYPCKYILSQASGIPTDEFIGGVNKGAANEVLEKLDFVIVSKE